MQLKSILTTWIVVLCSFIFTLVCGYAADWRSSLWDMTAYRKIPLNLQEISSRKVPLQIGGQAKNWVHAADSWVKGGTTKSNGASATSGIVVKPRALVVQQYYFDCGTSPEKLDRICFSLARPEKTEGKIPVLVVFHGGGGHGTEALAISLARSCPGCAVIAMDYNGQFMPGAKHVTEWRTVTRPMRRGTLNLVPDLRNIALYHYVMAARRQLDVLDKFPMLDSSRVACLGVSLGGLTAFDLAGVDNRVKCVVTFFSAGGFENTASRQSQVLRWGNTENAALWLAMYDPIAYAPWTHAAVLFCLGADDHHFWLSGALRQYRALPGEKRLLITPNCDHGAGGPALPARQTAATWIRHVLFGGETLPKVERCSLHRKGNVYSWRASGPEPITHAKLYWSPGKAVAPSSRYWLALSATKVGGCWQARIPKPYANLAAQMYITVWDAKGCAVSSTTFERGGLDPEYKAGPLWKGNAIWDTQRGADAWRPLTAELCPKTVILSFGQHGVKLGPAGTTKAFAALSNSIILASGHATKYEGLSLLLNGNGSPGLLTVELLRNEGSLDEVKFIRTVHYGAGTSRITIPWKDFKSVPGEGGQLARLAPSARNSLWPFNGLELTGTRVDGQSLTIANIAFADER